MWKQIQYSKQNVDNALNKTKNYITLYHTYILTYYIGHNQVTCNYSTINLQKENNRLKQMTIMH